ncbi:MAG: bifunctional folylpolyglutamate synthase/dihydrofolate synthase [Firmicutes bacterium]|nr:bifunctional folylpolyglutamate synthase/dihydrofolate synthase [Bacillota bacterium]
MEYEEALAYIHGLGRFGSRLGLERITRLLDLAGRPHSDLRVIHVAGTNGKGSVTALVASVLQAAGYRTGMYVSPYLEDFRERIQVDGQCIPERDLAAWVESLRPLADRVVAEGLDHPTEFEFITLLAMCYFAARRVDYVALEVGLGGRFDATNVVAQPLACVISNIALDHTDRLGHTLGEIAFEKAGIIKPGCPVVTGARDPEALEVIARVARDKGSRLLVAGEDFSWQERYCDWRGQRVDLHCPDRRFAGLFIPLVGRHQQSNTACAVTALEVGVPGLPERTVREGVAGCRWPGRLEVLAESPLVVIDAAHNPDGAAALRQALDLFPRRRLVMVLGVLKDKNAEAMVPLLAPLADLLVATTPVGPRAGAPERIADLARPLSREVAVEPDLADALEVALGAAAPGDMVLVAGSIYLVGPARALLRQRLDSRAQPTCAP